MLPGMGLYMLQGLHSCTLCRLLLVMWVTAAHPASFSSPLWPLLIARIGIPRILMARYKALYIYTFVCLGSRQCLCLPSIDVSGLEFLQTVQTRFSDVGVSI